MRSFLSHLIGTVARPGHTFEELSEEAALGPAAGAVLCAALIYSAFVLWMYLAGHAPSFTGIPIPAEHYYLWQAGFLPPWLLLAWAVSASVAHGVSRAFGSDAAWRETATPWAFALSVPLACTYVIPEMVVFGVAGHEALVAAMRITGPITLGWWAMLGTRAVRASHGSGWTASVAASIVGLLVFGGVTAVLVR